LVTEALLLFQSCPGKAQEPSLKNVVTMLSDYTLDVHQHNCSVATTTADATGLMQWIGVAAFLWRVSCHHPQLSFTRRKDRFLKTP